MEQPKKDYSIRLYRPGDEDKIVKLLIDVFQPWPKFDTECSAVDHWRWKFIDNPSNKEIYTHTVAEANGDIIGVDHGMLFYVKIGEGKYLSEKGADTAISSNYRGLGIYTKLSKLKHDTLSEMGFAFDFSQSNNPIFVKKRQNDPETEYLFPQLLKSLIKINDVDKHFKNAVEEKDPWKKFILKIGVHGSKILNKLSNLLMETPPMKEVTFKEITRFDDRINTFYEKIKPHYYFIVERTADYLNWRYCDKRGGDFKIWIAEKNDEIVGYLVLKINKLDVKYPEGYLVDLLTLNTRDDVADNLAKLAVAYFDERAVNVVLAQVVEGHPYERIFDKYGLLDTRMRPNLMWRAINLGDDLERFSKAPAAMLHYTIGDGDSI
jgi:hypothetical protein